MKTIFDFGMYDGADTVYFLDEGFKVVAVEANPGLVQNVSSVVGHYIESGQLQIINAAISTKNNPVELTVCGDDVGSSSTYEHKLAATLPLWKFTVVGG